MFGPNGSTYVIELDEQQIALLRKAMQIALSPSSKGHWYKVDESDPNVQDLIELNILFNDIERTEQDDPGIIHSMCR
jgi:hypothetical protein